MAAEAEVVAVVAEVVTVSFMMLISLVGVVSEDVSARVTSLFSAQSVSSLHLRYEVSGFMGCSYIHSQFEVSGVFLSRLNIYHRVDVAQSFGTSVDVLSEERKPSMVKSSAVHQAACGEARLHNSIQIANVQVVHICKCVMLASLVTGWVGYHRT